MSIVRQEPVRQKVMSFVSQTFKHLPPDILSELEQRVWDSFPGGPVRETDYTSRISRVFLPLKEDSPYYDSVYSQQITEGRLDLAVTNKLYIGANQQMETSAKLLAHGPKQIDSIIKCHKCGGNTTCVEVQTRSSDEGSTVIHTCLKCHRQFRC